jgi:hypothetical protein
MPKERKMAKLETALTLEQLLDKLGELSDEEQRAFAAAVLKERRLEAFVEELDDHLACEKAVEEGPAVSFNPEELTTL